MTLKFERWLRVKKGAELFKKIARLKTIPHLLKFIVRFYNNPFEFAGQRRFNIIITNSVLKNLPKNRNNFIKYKNTYF